jgi:hypothetical protein
MPNPGINSARLAGLRDALLRRLEGAPADAEDGLDDREGEHNGNERDPVSIAASAAHPRRRHGRRLRRRLPAAYSPFVQFPHDLRP